MRTLDRQGKAQRSIHGNERIGGTCEAPKSRNHQSPLWVGFGYSDFGQKADLPAPVLEAEGRSIQAGKLFRRLLYTACQNRR